LLSEPIILLGSGHFAILSYFATNQQQVCTQEALAPKSVASVNGHSFYPFRLWHLISTRCRGHAGSLAGWLRNELKPVLPALSEITVHETCTSGYRYRGPAA